MRLLLSIIVFMACCTASLADNAVDAAREWHHRHGAAILREYVNFLAMPNVASDLAGVQANAAYIAEQLSQRNVATEIWQFEDVPPVVYGRLVSEGATQTLGVYLHYDGQPVDRSQWSTPPWEPALYDAAIEAGGKPIPLPDDGQPIDPEWRIYARSAADDKAPFPALLGALDALQRAGLQPTVNLVFFFEGEEEAGSDNLERYMREHRAQLGVDGWLILDGPVHQSRRPQLVFGVRGYTGLDITVYGATRYLHSGHYGNWAPNPAMQLAQLLASMKSADGEVLIDGFTESVEPLGEPERIALRNLPDTDTALKKEIGISWTEGAPARLAERLLLPSLNVRGLESARVGDAARNIIPVRATASIDIRLVAGNDPTRMQEKVEAHIRQQGFHLVREEPDAAVRAKHDKIAKVNRRSGYPAARTALDSGFAQQVIAAAQRAAGEEIVILPSFGGSLPLYLFTDILHAPVIMMPIANHDNNQHAPDENLRLANLWYGMELFAAVFTMTP